MLRSQIHTAIRLSITFGKFPLSLAFPINYINHMLFCFFLFFCFSFFFSLRIFVYESQANPENGAMCQGYNKELSKILKLMKPDRKKMNYTRTAVNTEPNCTEPRRSAGVCKCICVFDGKAKNTLDSGRSNAYVYPLNYRIRVQKSSIPT